jgi:hypothetical protein
MQQEFEMVRIEKMIDNVRRLSVALDSMDVWDRNYPVRFAERDALNAQIEKAKRAYAENAAAVELAKTELTATYNAAMAYMQQMAAAELEREAASERAKLLLTQIAFYEQQGSAYMIKACAQDDPAEKLKAANAALACFRQLHMLSSAHAEVSILISNAQKVADAAQAELDKPRVFKFLEFVCELLVTG